MTNPIIQASFNSGEWAPSLYARVDVAKYHSGAALLRNFFVDYRGGASTRVGTKYVLQAYKSATAVRLIGFQGSIDVGYTLEFGDGYIRFHHNGEPVLESGIAITNVDQLIPCIIAVVNSYSVGDWIFISGVVGMTQLNGKYYRISARTAGTLTLEDLFGNPVDATGYTPYISGGTVQRVYTLAAPYAAADLALLKFTQNISVLILCHPSYVPYVLTFTAETNWAITAIAFGATIGPPTVGSVSTSLGAGNTYYGYKVTSIDGEGQESTPSDLLVLEARQDIRTVAGTNTITWNGVTGAQSYNVYKADVNIGAGVFNGLPMGYIGNVTVPALIDSNVAPDFSFAPPSYRNPFAVGSGVTSVLIGAQGSYTTAPTVSFAAPGGSGVTATGDPVMTALTAAVAAGGAGYAVGDTITVATNTVLLVGGVAAGAITSIAVQAGGLDTGTLPSNPVPQVSTSGSGTGATFNLTWGVFSVAMTNTGSGYTSVPAVTFSAGAALGTAVLGPSALGNPSVPAFFQQRLVLAATAQAPQGLFMSQTGNYYNFNVSNPVRADDAISANIVSGQLNNIKALIPQPGGLIVLTDGASFLINGGQLGAVVTPASISSNAQSFLGCNDMPPIVVNFDILYVQSKGSSVRDASYNFYANVFTGTDISIIASHLFFGYELLEWAWAEEPYKIVWAVRNDGTLLSLTFLKEQDFTGWAHSDTQGEFKSVATIVEPASVGYQNYLYCVVEREVQSQTLKYIEYMPERIFANGVEDAVTVDCCYQYSGSPATAFSGATALAGLTCTGLADGEVITPFVMGTDGTFTLPAAASKVTVGLAFTAQLKTLPLDTGDPTIQSKMKKIPASTIRVTETLGLEIGTDFDNLVAMKDLIRGNVGSMTNEVVTDLVTGDARTFLDPKWQEIGTFCIQQSDPLPATILGVVPQLTVGDTDK